MPSGRVRAFDWLYETAAAVELATCPQCGCASQVTVSVNGDSYPSSRYYSYESKPRPRFASEVRRVVISRKIGIDLLVKRRGAAILGKLLPLQVVKGIPPRATNLLDVGCGSGTGVQDLVDAGVEVWGVDIDERAVELARARGIRAIYGDFASADLPESYFDAVRMWHSIEHLSDPIRALSKARRLLRPGGVLIVGTPDITSLTSRMFGPRWYHLDPPRHLVVFSLSGLIRAVKEVGFEVTSIANWSDRGLFGSLLLLFAPHWKATAILRGLINSPFAAAAEWPIDIILTLTGRGDHIELVCKKRKDGDRSG